MYRRVRTVSDDLNVNKITINNLFKMYTDNELSVNRRYQRKLVWTLQEKKDFIDTLLRKYPIPLVLFVSYRYKDTNEKHTEIIDGLQRLEAIFAFISGRYSITFGKDSGYFNLDALPGYGSRVRSDEIHQNMPCLPLELCEQLLDYEIPCSTTEKSDDDIDEIFRRINSKGRVLANQSLRQAGITGQFADLVRKTSSYIRGDYTDEDLISINKISDYSLNNDGLDYGVDINSAFFLKQDIINETQLRKSKDEEIVAHIYIYLLTRGKYSPSTNTLSKAYDTSNSLKQELDDVIGCDFYDWMEFFAKNISILNKAFLKSNFKHTLFTNGKVYNKDHAFTILFLAIANLRLSGMELKDEKLFKSTLVRLGDYQLSELTKSSEIVWNKEIRDRLIERVQNYIVKCFGNLNPQHNNIAEWDVKLVNLLEHAKVEEQMYDFKVGITDFRNDKFNEKCIPKIVETLTAMVNTFPNKEGYIVLGIPNNNNDAIYISQKLKTNIETCRYIKILGIEDEANKYYGGVDHYLQKIKNIIENEPISSAFKNEILTKCQLIQYKEKLLYLFVCKSSQPVYYNKKLYVRYGSHNHQVEYASDEFNLIMKRFYEIKDTN